MLQDNALMTDGIAHLWAHLAESDPMIDAETIQNRVDELAEQINGRYPDGVSIIAVMTGAIPFVPTRRATADAIPGGTGGGDGSGCAGRR
jgi:hypothetical protein